MRSRKELVPRQPRAARSPIAILPIPCATIFLNERSSKTHFESRSSGLTPHEQNLRQAEIQRERPRPCASIISYSARTINWPSAPAACRSRRARCTSRTRSGFCKRRQHSSVSGSDGSNSGNDGGMARSLRLSRSTSPNFHLIFAEYAPLTIHRSLLPNVLALVDQREWASSIPAGRPPVVDRAESVACERQLDSTAQSG